MKKLIKNIINFLTERCECGGHLIAWDDRKSFCDKCGREE